MPANPFAFPGQPYGSDGLPMADAEPGVTVRDYFAAHALQGLLASGRWDNAGAGFEAYISTHATNIADAMLAERERVR